MAADSLFENVNISTSSQPSDTFTNSLLSTYSSQSQVSADNSTRDEILNTISILDCFILVVGTFGNLISFYLLTRKRLRQMSTMRYLAILCFIDTICLFGWYLSSIYRQLSGDGFKRIENINRFSCKFISFLSFSSLQLSSVMLCCLTIDRLLIIISSRWRAKYSTPKVANILLTICTITICLLNLVIPIRLGNDYYVEYSFFKNLKTKNLNGYATTTTTESTTTIVKALKGIMNVNIKSANYTLMEPKVIVCYNELDLVLSAWNKLHLCIYSLIPFPILFVLNLIVIHMIRIAARAKEAHKRLKQGQQFVIRLLLFLTLSFLFSTLPSTIVYAFWHNQVLNMKYGRVFLNLLNTLQFSRHSSNWLIYIYSSSFIRDEFKKCVLCNENDYEISNGDDFDLGVDGKLPAGSLSSSFFYRLQMENINLSDVFNFRKSVKKRNNPAALNVPNDISESENQSLNSSIVPVHNYRMQNFENFKNSKKIKNGNGVLPDNKQMKLDTSI